MYTETIEIAHRKSERTQYTPPSGCLLVALKRQDHQAQSTLWRQHWQRVYRICNHILAEKADAEDVSCEVLTDFLFRYVHNVAQPAAIGTYLRLMAVRRSLRLRDKQTRFDSLEETSLKPQDIPGEHFLQSAWFTPQIKECMSALTPKANLVLRLRYGHGMTSEEIGRRVGGSKQYIGRLISRSLQHLGRCLEQRRHVSMAQPSRQEARAPSPRALRKRHPRKPSMMAMSPSELP
ncbi:MAG: sigma-70 family RNA polymerase sigma factor [Myxococcota bacterium]